MPARARRLPRPSPGSARARSICSFPRTSCAGRMGRWLRTPTASVSAATFDRAAELYHRARPDYPDELYDELVAVTGLSRRRPPARGGVRYGKGDAPSRPAGISHHLSRAWCSSCRRRAAKPDGFDVDVVQTRFEDWTPPPDRFAMVFAATSWHWVDPGVRYQKAADVLEPGGYLAVWGAGHVIPYDGDPFFEELQEIYDEIGESLPPDAVLPRPQELADDRDEIESSGLFDVADDQPVRLGDRLRRRRLHRPPEHLLRPHRHAGVAAGPALRRNPPASLPATRRPPPQTLGRRPPGGSTPPLTTGGSSGGSSSSHGTPPPVGRYIAGVWWP